MAEPLLKAMDLGVVWHTPKGPVQKVSGVSFELSKGGSLTLMGETGCGKTLAAQAVLGILPRKMESTGQVLLNNSDVTRLKDKAMKRLWGRKVFLFPQEPAAALNPALKAGSQIREVFRFVRGYGRAEAAGAAARTLERLGLGNGDGGLHTCKMSGGMLQRLAAAITIAEPAELVICDEPTKGLDPSRRQEVTDLFNGMKQDGKAVLIITHDLKVAQNLGGELAVMYGGRIMEMGPAGQLISDPAHPYTRALLAASPEAGLIPIPNRLHEKNVNGGCPFSPRCHLAREICFTKPPGHHGETRKNFCHAA